MIFTFFPFSPNFIFAECSHNTFLFHGRCYNSCPDRTFIVPEKVSENALKRRAGDSNEFDSLEDILIRTETMKHRAAAAQKLCGSCHQSCLKCKGPTKDDCIACEFDYNQIIIGSNIMCQSVKVESDKSFLSYLKSYSIQKIALISTAVGIFLMISCILINLLCIKFDCDIFSTFCEGIKHFMSTASNNASTQEQYTYNVIEMEDTPLTLPRTTFDGNEDDSDNSDDVFV